MASLTEIMQEMADTLDAAFTSLDVAVQVEPLMWFNPTPPCVDIYPGDPFADGQGAGFGDVTGKVTFTVRARVSTADTEAGQTLLLALMDDEDDLSVATALMDDQTLNGLASTVYVQGPTGYVHYIDAGANGSLLGCEWRVTVLRNQS